MKTERATLVTVAQPLTTTTTTTATGATTKPFKGRYKKTVGKLHRMLVMGGLRGLDLHALGKTPFSLVNALPLLLEYDPEVERQQREQQEQGVVLGINHEGIYHGLLMAYGNNEAISKHTAENYSLDPTVIPDGGRGVVFGMPYDQGDQYAQVEMSWVVRF
eukprot:m.372757 g.372757  ORF g.372757 m.372757 type:complete len:161 (+) comp19995_c14_seq12:592-1074(+)